MSQTWCGWKTELYETLLLFHANYQCPKCEQKAAFYLEECDNPLHILHENFYRLETEKLK